MKRIKADILTTFMVTLSVALSIFFIVAYFMSKQFLLELLSSPSLRADEVMLHFHIVWLQLFILFFVLCFVAFFVAYELARRIVADVHSLKEYLIDISENKDYESPLQVDSYLEVLEASVYAKNIAKRLYQKEKKLQKK